MSDSLSISSMKSVPPSARATLPGLSFTAPVNAPFFQPEELRHLQLLGHRQQIQHLEGALRRAERSWHQRASRDLPAPVGPLISSVSSCCAKTRSMGSRLAMDLPTTGRNSSTSGGATGRGGRPDEVGRGHVHRRAAAAGTHLPPDELLAHGRQAAGLQRDHPPDAAPGTRSGRTQTCVTWRLRKSWGLSGLLNRAWCSRGIRRPFHGEPDLCG